MYVVRTKCTMPINAQVVVNRRFLTKLRGNNTGYLAQTFYTLGRRTIVRHVVTLVVTVENVTEAILYREVLIDLVFGRNSYIKLRLLLEVFVVTLTILQNPERVNQRVITKILSETEGIITVVVCLTRINLVRMDELQARTFSILYEVRIRTDKRSLNQTQYVGRRDIAVCIALSPTVITKVVGITRVSKVNTRCKVLEEVDVSIETNVQTIEVVVTRRCITLSKTK